jgi:RNA polymerase sigma-70 factor (ECF subfamily)
MRERSDEALMKAYADGDMSAFEHLYNRHRGPLYRYILRQVGDAATANDLFQGSWEKIIKARGRYKDSAPFKAWMYRIAHNHVMDHFRREQPAADTQAEDMADNQVEPVERISAENRQQHLVTAIEKLPPEQKDTLLLKLESGLDLQTIADVTGVNRETAKSRLRYAVKKLRQVMGSLELSQEL